MKHVWIKMSVFFHAREISDRVVSLFHFSRDSKLTDVCAGDDGVSYDFSCKALLLKSSVFAAGGHRCVSVSSRQSRDFRPFLCCQRNGQQEHRTSGIHSAIPLSLSLLALTFAFQTSLSCSDSTSFAISFAHDTIVVHSPDTLTCTITLYNLLGNAIKPFGQHTLKKGRNTFNCSDLHLPPGICIIVLSTNSIRIIRRLIVE